MTSLVEEIQAVADNADRCVNYPIGDKLEAFIREQDDQNERNFIVSGILIYAAARIYGRKVDYLEQEILGIRKNFKDVTASDEKLPEKEMKKSRSKKFVIADRVNIEKQTFEERPIQVLAKVDINETLASPIRIDRLQRMKEFFSKNKSRSGKLVIPKSLLFSNDNVLSNFGSTQIYEFDDNKDVVGSRRDFTSFSYFINSTTGELQSDLIMTRNNPSQTADFEVSARENICADIPEIWATPPTSPLRLISTSRPQTPSNEDSPDEFYDASENLNTTTNNKIEPLSINIDEGVEVDEATKATMLLSPLTVKLMDIVRKSPNLFPETPKVNDSINIDEFGNSILTVPHEVTNHITDFDLPFQMISDAEPKMKNIFMIPLKKLKRKCNFDLPNDIFGELKQRKREQFRPLGAEPLVRQARVFKPLEMPDNMLDIDPDDQPFLGFTKEQQDTLMTNIDYEQPLKHTIDHLKEGEMTRKLSDDSGWMSGNETGNNSSDNTGVTSDDTRVNSDDFNDSQEFSLPLDTSQDTLNTTTNDATGNESNISKLNIGSGDSCYHSCVSGDSTKTDLSSFFRDIETRNNTIDESIEASVEDEPEENSEKVLQMQQSALNIAKWKEYLKPILAGSEARSKIDMHEYGVEMINKIGNVNDVTSLAEITEPGKTPAYFLSMLQLINNRNVEIEFGERTMLEPVDIRNIKIKLKSKILHREKFNEMGQQFVLDEEKKVCQKRKAVQTSTPAKRAKLAASISQYISPNISQTDDVPSQCSSGYFSQSSMLSDC